ncbi:hypothetical protein ACFVOK_14240 [Streptomyces sp. NPDC057798]|uniref:hypothetical protein n=1 Tax=Streptomyces sp. NPDC057798 TaxID=3346252 RepID=UPI0036A5A38C
MKFSVTVDPQPPAPRAALDATGRLTSAELLSLALEAMTPLLDCPAPENTEQRDEPPTTLWWRAGAVLCRGEHPGPPTTLDYDITLREDEPHPDGTCLLRFDLQCHSSTGRHLLTARDVQARCASGPELASTLPAARGTDSAADVVRGRPTDGERPVPCRAFTAAEVRAFAEGRPWDCFGPRLRTARAQVRPPSLPRHDELYLRTVTHFDPAGGRHAAGRLRAAYPLRAGRAPLSEGGNSTPHATLGFLVEGVSQAMAFCLAALSPDPLRDGWRFDWAHDHAWRLDATDWLPTPGQSVEYDIEVTALSANPVPRLTADVVCTADGRTVLRVESAALCLTPDYPLTQWRQLARPPAGQRDEVTADPAALAGLAGHVEPRPAADTDGFRYDYPAVLATAWGRPSDAYGPAYADVDDTRRLPRLPSPPFLFISRIAAVEGPQGGMRAGSAVTAEYDLPDPDAVWYRTLNSTPSMPFSVLLEAALQPCGWLAAYACDLPAMPGDVLLRNLDGTITVAEEVSRDARLLRTEAELTSVSRTGDMVIQTFDVRCTADGRHIASLQTVFGYFPPIAFTRQNGLPASTEERAALAAPCDHHVDLTERAGPPRAGTLGLPRPPLLMLDRVTGYWPGAGKAGLGRLRAEKRVDPGEWFFRAHFFQDPVQPGSLGLEAIIQLLQFWMIDNELTAGLPHPRFEPVRTGHAMTWKYRGQVVPDDALITVEMDITRAGVDEKGPFATADAWLWVDGRRIYQARDVGVRVLHAMHS